MDFAVTTPNHVTTKNDAVEIADHANHRRLDQNQQNPLQSNEAPELALDMGNAITSYGRADNNATVRNDLIGNNPNDASFIAEEPSDNRELHELDGFRSRANLFSDPFLVDLTSVLRLMHETSEKLRKASKELREAENQNSQAQMQASAESIKASGQFQAIAGGIGAGLSIAGGASGLAGAVGGVKSLNTLRGAEKLGFQGEAPRPSANMPKVDVKAEPIKPNNTIELSDLDPSVPQANQVSRKPADVVEADDIGMEINNAKTDLANINSESPQQMTREQFTIRMREIDMAAQRWQASGGMIDGVGKALSAGIGSIATGFEASKAIHDKQASQAQFEKEQTNDLVKSLTEFTQQIRQVIQSILAAQDSAAQRVSNV